MWKTYIDRVTSELVEASTVKNVGKVVNLGDGCYCTATDEMRKFYEDNYDLESDECFWVVVSENSKHPDYKLMLDSDFVQRFELYSEKHKVYNRITSVLNHISLEGMLSNMELFVSKPIEFEGNLYYLYLQVKCNGICNVTGEHQKWSGRKWQLSEHMTDQEIVQTAFKAILTAIEHETRELFKYKGVSILDPHYDIEKFVELRKQSDSVVQCEKHIPEGRSSASELVKTNENESTRELEIKSALDLPRQEETWFVEMQITQPSRNPSYVKGDRHVVKLDKNYPPHVKIDKAWVHINHVKFLEKLCMNKNNLTDVEKDIEVFNKVLINSDFKKSDNKTYEVFAINWTEYERGWGDGHTLYKTATDAYDHRNEFVIKHDHKNPSSTYTYPGVPFVTKVNQEIYDKLCASEEKFIWGSQLTHAKPMM